MFCVSIYKKQTNIVQQYTDEVESFMWDTSCNEDTYFQGTLPTLRASLTLTETDAFLASLSRGDLVAVFDSELSGLTLVSTIIEATYFKDKGVTEIYMDGDFFPSNTGLMGIRNIPSQSWEEFKDRYLLNNVYASAALTTVPDMYINAEKQVDIVMGLAWNLTTRHNVARLPFTGDGVPVSYGVKLFSSENPTAYDEDIPQYKITPDQVEATRISPAPGAVTHLQTSSQGPLAPVTALPLQIAQFSETASATPFFIKGTGIGAVALKTQNVQKLVWTDGETISDLVPEDDVLGIFSNAYVIGDIDSIHVYDKKTRALLQQFERDDIASVDAFKPGTTVRYKTQNNEYEFLFFSSYIKTSLSGSDPAIGIMWDSANNSYKLIEQATAYSPATGETYTFVNARFTQRVGSSKNLVAVYARYAYGPGNLAYITFRMSEIDLQTFTGTDVQAATYNLTADAYDLFGVSEETVLNVVATDFVSHYFHVTSDGCVSETTLFALIAEIDGIPKTTTAVYNNNASLIGWSGYTANGYADGTLDLRWFIAPDEIIENSVSTVPRLRVMGTVGNRRYVCLRDPQWLWPLTDSNDVTEWELGAGFGTSAPLYEFTDGATQLVYTLGSGAYAVLFQIALVPYVTRKTGGVLPGIKIADGTKNVASLTYLVGMPEGIENFQPLQEKGRIEIDLAAFSIRDDENHYSEKNIQAIELPAVGAHVDAYLNLEDPIELTHLIVTGCQFSYKGRCYLTVKGIIV